MIISYLIIHEHTIHIVYEYAQCDMRFHLRFRFRFRIYVYLYVHMYVCMYYVYIPEVRSKTLPCPLQLSP